STEFQIDSLLIYKNALFPLEINYFEGDYYYEEERFHVVGSRKEIRSPLLQLQRTEFLFKHLLQRFNVNMNVKPYIIFVNKEFKLYQSPLNKPMIYPTQIKRFIQKINSSSGILTDSHKRIAEKLASLHITDSGHSRL